MPTTTAQIEVINPATGENIFNISLSSQNDVKEKVRKAREAFSVWSSIGVEKRAQYIKNIYDIIIKKREHIAEVITKNNGKPLAEAYLTEIAAALQVMEHFINKGSQVFADKNIPLGPFYPTRKSFMSYEPLGVMAIIEPWNFPFYLPLSAITKTLIAGNTFVFKPSSVVAMVGKEIEDILNEANLPDGVANVIYGGGSIAETLIDSDVDKVIFTGSVEIGRGIAKKCAERLLPCMLELGGKDPAIVLKNTNLDFAAKGVIWGAISNCGQACASIERVYVEKDVYDAFTEKIVSEVKKLKVGNGLDKETDVGPLINEEQVRKIEDQVQDALSKGAKVLAGGKRLEGKGFFFQPTVLVNINHSMKVMYEETFGPVIPIMSFESIEEAIKLSNDCKYGLAGSIWSSDLQKASKIAKNLNCGTVWVNDSLFQQAHPSCPWQGYKESGYGSSTIYDYTRTKHISVDQGFIPSLRPKNVWWYPYKGKARAYFDLIEVIYKQGIKDKAVAAFHTMIDFLK